MEVGSDSDNVIVSTSSTAPEIRSRSRPSSPFPHPFNIPGQRPSYASFSSVSGLFPSVQAIDERVIKRLDLDLELLSDTITTDYSSGSGDCRSHSNQNEKLKTFLRIRPPSSHLNVDVNIPVFANQNQVLTIQDSQTVLAFPTTKNTITFPKLEGRRRKQIEFKFSKVLGPECGQSTVFEECVTPLIEKFLGRENCLIFSYGATNSGKTYTMQGHGTEYGIIPRTLDTIFNRINDRLYKLGNIKPHLYEAFLHLNPREVEALFEKRDRVVIDANVKQEFLESYCRLSSSSISDKSSNICVDFVGTGHNFEPSSSSSTMYSIWVSYAELYNERVYDLLDNSQLGSKKRRKELKLLQDRNGFVYIKDLAEFPVNSDEEAYKLFLAGRKNLQFAATQMNLHSSRSHSFFTIRVVSLGIGNGMVPYPKTVHRLTFCDLAGMERASQTENEGIRLKESGTINNSLTVLLKVIRLLREKQNGRGGTGAGMIETIPFRDSKLTHIFKSYLSSSTHVCMVVNVSPDPFVADSTLQVLQNSAIASNVIVFKPVDVNVRANLLPKKLKESEPEPPLFSTFTEKFSSSTSPSRFSTTESDDEYDYGLPTVVAPKTMAQKVANLERQVASLKEQLAASEFEKQKIREDMLKMIVDERILWNKRLQQRMLTEQNLNRRRLSLVKYETMLSPATRCGRCSPPTADMEDIDETFEGEEEVDEETKNQEPQDESDKENWYK
ncbi:unnamed protein product [Orchesella dallaii]|uniref:Kinesin motor domain-containing protein n=1 Tax=Orchesella dallaii TaxID=48710 RepID=A0ABP1PLE1_9HEXA